MATSSNDNANRINEPLKLELMDLKLYKEQKVRIQTDDTGINAPFIDVKSEENSSETHYNKFISTILHCAYPVFIIKKDRSVKTFMFKMNEVVKKSDFGWWSDGEVLFTNYELIE